MKISRNPAFFPILINLKYLPCLVIGGGKVAVRKVLSLLDFNADITVLSPRFCQQLIDLSKSYEIKIIKKSYSKKYINNFKIVFCTTDNSKINQTVYKDCKEAGILLNVADDPLLCDFILPANIKRGSLTISVSSQGKAPFFVKGMKKKLEQFVSPVYSEIADLAGEYRDQIMKKAKAKSLTAKAKMFGRFLVTDWETLLAEKGKEDSRIYMQKILKEFN
jgi:precorrin-2 dehydrogenase/sirohydrochlorin ferrochelatase